ncbi:MAG: peptidylprolyl isomerase [Candidatus ainarchaeum sp.]|nr:peptidylprolyl isomerase [Candidatus ainarchaeum sp.]
MAGNKKKVEKKVEKKDLTPTKAGKPVNNDYVAVEYTGKFTDGKVFDSSKGREPLVFQVGVGQVIKGFDDAVKGLEVGKSKEITIKAKEAYGEKNTKEVKIPKAAFQDQSMIKEGLETEMMTNMGPMHLKITKVEKDTISAVLNHPLAGKDLVFEIKLVKILSKKELEEEMQKHSCGCGCGHDDCKDDKDCGCH